MPDSVGDELIAKDPELQAVIQGREVMLWRPGQTSGLLVQATLVLGWIGTSLALFWFSKPSVQGFYYYIVGALIVAAPINILNYRMVRGWPRARAHIYLFSVFLVITAIATLGLCALGRNIIASALACAGLVFSTIAMLLIASRTYALLSAGFRAQRKYLGS